MIYIDLYSVHVLFSSYIAYIWPEVFDVLMILPTQGP